MSIELQRRSVSEVSNYERNNDVTSALNSTSTPSGGLKFRENTLSVAGGRLASYDMQCKNTNLYYVLIMCREIIKKISNTRFSIVHTDSYVHKYYYIVAYLCKNK
jgi:hypothetical protein